MGSNSSWSTVADPPPIPAQNQFIFDLGGEMHSTPRRQCWPQTETNSPYKPDKQSSSSYQSCLSGVNSVIQTQSSLSNSNSNGGNLTSLAMELPLSYPMQNHIQEPQLGLLNNNTSSPKRQQSSESYQYRGLSESVCKVADYSRATSANSSLPGVENARQHLDFNGNQSFDSSSGFDSFLSRNLSSIRSGNTLNSATHDKSNFSQSSVEPQEIARRLWPSDQVGNFVNNSVNHSDQNKALGKTPDQLSMQPSSRHQNDNVFLMHNVEKGSNQAPASHSTSNFLAQNVPSSNLTARKMQNIGSSYFRNQKLGDNNFSQQNFENNNFSTQCTGKARGTGNRNGMPARIQLTSKDGQGIDTEIPSVVNQSARSNFQNQTSGSSHLPMNGQSIGHNHLGSRIFAEKMPYNVEKMVPMYSNPKLVSQQRNGTVTTMEKHHNLAAKDRITDFPCHKLGHAGTYPRSNRYDGVKNIGNVLQQAEKVSNKHLYVEDLGPHEMYPSLAQPNHHSYIPNTGILPGHLIATHSLNDLFEYYPMDPYASFTPAFLPPEMLCDLPPYCGLPPFIQGFKQLR